MFDRLKSLFAAGSPAAADKIAHKKKGDEHLRLGRLSDAAECYGLALSSDPDYVEACVALGFALSEQKLYAEAEKYLRHALSLDPEHADAHYVLGTISRNTDDRASAIHHRSRALVAKPDFEFAHLDLVAVLLNSGQLRQAKDALRTAIAAHPGSAEFQY